MGQASSEFPRLIEFDLQLVYDPAEPEERRWCAQLAMKDAYIERNGGRCLYRAYAASSRAAAVAVFTETLIG